MRASAQHTSLWGHTAVAAPGSAASAFPAGRLVPELQTVRLFLSLTRLWRGCFSRGALRFQVKPRRMKLQETVQLGEKRFVAILRVDGQEFLLGGGSAGLSILAQLHPEPATTTFATVLSQQRVQEEQA